MKILKILGEKKNLKETAHANLINEKLKKNEIKNNKIFIETKIIDNYYSNFLDKLKINKIVLEEEFKNKLYEKVRLEVEWNNLIYKLYYNKININTAEIKNKLRYEDKKNNFLNEKKLIDLEKNNKIKVFSNYHLNIIKSRASIKYYKWKKQLRL